MCLMSTGNLWVDGGRQFGGFSENPSRPMRDWSLVLDRIRLPAGRRRRLGGGEPADPRALSVKSARRRKEKRVAVKGRNKSHA